ncbi:polymer-forming cytoskeletal protein [Oceanirhabdus sp. W0125-5]|uniref:polymer-forming cytoskeletal protein n=1 Tax=Oceanirhabdus sp. W0125-5 TaxID=2999116 RepID=UPI0022F2A550|nr:polymer-forming cytoskeletal protein [Oceanirhabdus sp. W0125-5]WBW98068.1 polymer-forming cytoskeletal protein [Oceanirhabdus sp. W0125-5]
MSELRDVKISGSSTITGGEYNIVKISGSGKINGDIKCNKFGISGSASVDGYVYTDELRISGSCKIIGDTKCETGRISGSATIEGNMSGKEIRISGGTKITGDMNFNTIQTSGSLAAGGDVEGENIVINGACKVEGLINGEDINIKLDGKSYSKELGGEKITINKSQGNSFLGIFVKAVWKGSFVCESIEGNEIDIEYTECSVVRGKNIKIGPGCKIAKVEYYDILDIHEDAEVGEKIKL